MPQIRSQQAFLGGGNSSLLEYDSEGNLIIYPLEGETFKKTAERLGFKPGTPEYTEFVNANPQAGKRRKSKNVKNRMCKRTHELLFLYG